jgi:hypothetical protein
MYKNTRETTGTVVAVSTDMKLANGRKVNVGKLSKQDYLLLETIYDLSMDSYLADESYSPEITLQVEVISDTFREGVVGKLLNLQEVHDAWVKAHKEALK